MIEEEEFSFPHPLAMFLVAVVSACVVAFCIWVTNFYIKKTRGYDFTWNLIVPKSCELKLGHKGYYRLSTNSDSTLWAIRYGGREGDYNSGLLGSMDWWNISDRYTDRQAIIVTDSCKAKGIYQIYLKQDHKDFNNK